MSDLSHHIHRARLLMEQQRFADAESELRQHLGSDPRDVEGLCLLAIVLGATERYDEAREVAHQAIAEDPEEPWAHYGLGCVQLHADRDKEAEACALQALELDPEEPQFWGLLSAARIGRKRWEEALDAADKGLALEADNVGLLNLRSRILTILGRKDEVGPAAARALHESPDDANSHASAGWAALHSGDSKAALVHYREALRLEPDLEFARQGALEALRVRNPLYRALFGYFTWISRLGGKGMLVMIGAYVAYRFGFSLRSELTGVPRIALTVLLVAYGVFAVSTWLVGPIANVTLFFHPLGRLALTRKERLHSGVTVLLLVVSLSLCGIWLWLDSTSMFVATMGFAAATLVVAAVGMLLDTNREAIGVVAAAPPLLFALFNLAAMSGILPFLGGLAQALEFGWSVLSIYTLACLFGFQFLAASASKRVSRRQIR